MSENTWLERGSRKMVVTDIRTRISNTFEDVLPTLVERFGAVDAEAILRDALTSNRLIPSADDIAAWARQHAEYKARPANAAPEGGAR